VSCGIRGLPSRGRTLWARPTTWGAVTATSGTASTMRAIFPKPTATRKPRTKRASAPPATTRRRRRAASFVRSRSNRRLMMANVSIFTVHPVTKPKRFHSPPGAAVLRQAWNASRRGSRRNGGPVGKGRCNPPGVVGTETGYGPAVTDAPETPAEDLPQDPGTTGLASEAGQRPGSGERPEPEEEETGTDAAGRTPRHRAGE
jgi:hypothetical protein